MFAPLGPESDQPRSFNTAPSNAFNRWRVRHEGKIMLGVMAGSIAVGAWVGYNHLEFKKDTPPQETTVSAIESATAPVDDSNENQGSVSGAIFGGLLGMGAGVSLSIVAAQPGITMEGLRRHGLINS